MNTITELIERSTMSEEDIRETRIRMSHVAHDNKTDAVIVFTSYPLSFHPRVTNAMCMCVCVCMDMWYAYPLCVCVEMWYVYVYLFRQNE
jgi:hypothetical protein